MNSICNNIIKILKDDELVISDIYINEETKLFQDLGMDSLSFIVLISKLEDFYNVSINQDLEYINSSSSIDDLANIVKKAGAYGESML